MTLLALAMTLTNNVSWLSLCILFALLLGTSQYTSDKDDSCNVFDGQEVKFNSCPKDCSQNDTDYFFNCSIGGGNELALYKYNLDGKTKELGEFLDPPSLKDIKFKFGIFEKVPAGAIYIKFQLPKAKNKVLPEAVQLYFEGISEDDYYTKCVRERIFLFKNYYPPSTKEFYQPRQLSYTCFYGAGRERSKVTQERDRDKRGYKLGLKSSPGKWRNYTVTINVLSPHLPTEHWKPTIAVSLDITNVNLSVLVEKVPDMIQVSYTNVELYLLPHRSLVKLEKLENQECTFSGLIHGKYIIKVVIHGRYNMTNLSWTGETIEIDATAIPQKDTMMRPVKILYMVGGCVIGVILIVLLAVIVHRKRVCKKIIAYNRNPVKGFILHPFDGVSHSNQMDFVDQYKIFLEETCSCKLLQKKMPEIRQKIQNGTSFSFVLVFHDQSYKKPADLEDPYSHILKETAKQKAKDKLRIIPIHFTIGPYGPPSVIPPNTSVRWDNFESVYCQMHRVDQPPASMQTVLRSEWKSTKTGKYLVEKFERLSSHLTTPQIEKPNNEYVPENPMETSYESMNEFAKTINLKDDENGRSIREYNGETSTHSIQAEVHPHSLDRDKTIDNTVNLMSIPPTDNTGPAVPVHETCHDSRQHWEPMPHDQSPKVNNTSGLPKDTQIFKSSRNGTTSGTKGNGGGLHTNGHVNETNAASSRQMLLAAYGLHADNRVIGTPNGRQLNDHLSKEAWHQPNLQRCSPQAALNMNDSYPRNPIHTKIPHHLQNHHHGNHGGHGHTFDQCYENSPLMNGYHNGVVYAGGDHCQRFNGNQSKGSPGFQNQPIFGINIPPEGFRQMENVHCKRAIGNPDMHARESRDHTHHWLSQSHWNDHDRYNEHHIPVEAVTERIPLLPSTEPQDSERRIQFDAVDPIRPECKSLSMSRSLKDQTEDDSLGYVTRGPGMDTGASVDDIQSVSQEDLRRLGSREFDFARITPPVYDHTSEESLSSIEQEEELKEINKNAQANVREH